MFGRRRWDAALEHVGQIHAADVDTALLLVRETHFRHEEGVEYAVVESGDLHILEDTSLLQREVDISYRLQSGYAGFRDKRQAARDAADARGRGHARDRAMPGRGGGGS